jgi:catechol 2,3-dioxygenase-like lactoylglutathione lyase family enzyme
MDIQKLDHVNIRTADLPAITAFYQDVLGLELGPRPPFGSPGSWMYAGGHPIVHISSRRGDPMQGSSQIDHIAFGATGIAATLEKLKSHKIAYQCVIVPESEVRQVFFLDIEGNKLELDFAPGEMADFSNYDGS